MVPLELMHQADTWPVRSAAVGPAAVGTSLWRFKGQLSVTVVVKACFALVPDGVMALVAPEPLYVRARYESGGVTFGPIAPRETVPLLPRAEVVVVGHAHAPAEPTRELTARLCLWRDEQAVLDKAIHVRGNRARDGELEPFDRMPLVFERALGGIGAADNPLGVGLGGAGEPPNLVSVTAPDSAVGCFAPIPALFPVRQALLGTSSREAIAQTVADIPEDLDWSYFHSAPPDQRLDALRGDEWLELEGMTAGSATLRTRLAQARAVVQILGERAEGVPRSVPLVADLVHIDTDQQRCAVVWRGSFPVASEAVLAPLLVAGAVELPGQPVRWPASAEEVPLGALQAPAQVGASSESTADVGQTKIYVPGGAPKVGVDSTNEMTTAQIRAAVARQLLPFEKRPPSPDRTSSSAPAQAIPGAPWTKNVAKPVPQPRDICDATIDMRAADLPMSILVATAGAGQASRTDEGGTAGAAAEQAAAEEKAAAEGAAAQERAAAEQAGAEAEARRQAEAERFAAEQKEARLAAERQRAARIAERRKAAKELRANLYSQRKKRGKQD